MSITNIFKVVPQNQSKVSSTIGTYVSYGFEDLVDYNRIRKVTSIVLGDADISSELSQDSILCLIRDLLNASLKLYKNDGSAKVSFHEGPWEITFESHMKWIFITFYKGGRIPKVLVKDRPVLPADLKKGVISSAKDILKRAKTSDGAKTNPVISQIKDACNKLEKVKLPILKSEAPAVKPEIINNSRWHKPRDTNSISFGFQIKTGITDLKSENEKKPGDITPLLFRGRLCIHHGERRTVLGDGFLFCQMERMVSSVNRLLHAWEEDREMSSRLLSGNMVLGVTLKKPDKFSANFSDGSRKDSLVLHNIDLWKFIDAVLGVARELRRFLINLDKRLVSNLRLKSLNREVNRLSTLAREQRRPNKINKDVTSYEKLAKIHRPNVTSGSLGNTGRLKFSQMWRLEVEGLDLNNTLIGDKIVLIATRDALVGLDKKTGSILWKRDTNQQLARIEMSGKDNICRITMSGIVELIDLQTGSLVWKTKLNARSGNEPVVMVVDKGNLPGSIIVAEGEKKIVSLDIRTGEPVWKFSASRGGPFTMMRYGKLMYFTSTDSHFNALDLEDGKVVWRFADKRRFFFHPAVTGNNLLVTGGRPGRHEGTLYCLNAFSGVCKWKVSLNGGAHTAPLIADNSVLLPIRTANLTDYEQVFATFNLDDGKELWRKNCEGWIDSGSLMALDNSFIINSANGTLRAVNARTCEDEWVFQAEEKYSNDVPVNLRTYLRGGALFVPSGTINIIRPENGQLIHSFGDESPVPDMMHVDISCSTFVAEESGHIAMFDLAAKLKAVQPV